MPRFSGGDDEEKARRHCATILESAGFEALERPFDFSSIPARAGPSIGAALLAFALLTAHFTTTHNLPHIAFAVLIAAIVVLRLAGKWVLTSGMQTIPWGRIASANLIATPRGSVQPPKVWLVAHLDSKSQTIPMLVRIVSVAVLAVFYVTTVIVLMVIVVQDIAGFATPLGPHESQMMGVAWLAALIGAVATVPLIFCFIGNNSRGAVDNASGVASVILAVEMIREREKVGVIITSGEELGLAGARTLVSTMPHDAVALNCDTIDDGGRFICMSSGRMPERLSNAIDRAAHRTGVEIRKQGMLPGILADNIAFSSAGWESFTLSRGNIGTLARVHTSRDRAEQIEGTGIAMAAQLLAATAEELS